jgi:hypothetical protein
MPHIAWQRRDKGKGRAVVCSYRELSAYFPCPTPPLPVAAVREPAQYAVDLPTGEPGSGSACPGRWPSGLIDCSGARAPRVQAGSPGRRRRC